MAINTPGSDPKSFQRGEVLSASHLNQVLRALIRRIIGSDPVQVAQAASGHISISLREGGLRRPVTTVLAELDDEIDGKPGTYEWSKVEGNGPDGYSVADPTDPQIPATELNLTTGIASGTKVQLYLFNGVWYFAIGGLPVVAPVLANIESEVGSGVYHFSTYKGKGPAGTGNVCRELNLSTGIVAGTKVVCYLADGTYYFFFPVVTL